MVINNRDKQHLSAFERDINKYAYRLIIDSFQQRQYSTQTHTEIER